MLRPTLAVGVMVAALGADAMLADGVLAQRAPARAAGASATAHSDSAVLAALPFRSLGPAIMSGRIADVAIPDGPAQRGPGARLGKTMYVASATGGVWKTTNGGITYTPVFDKEHTISVGDVTVAPSNPDVVWVGTGEPNNMRSSSWGNGVYKSVDGGSSWTHMGLERSQHIGRIVIHPTDPNVVYVASVGPLWASGGERGLYRTADGGKSWTVSLRTSEHTGVTDVIFDPTDPDVLYAATLQRQRTAYSYVGGGPETGIFKSTDAGATWTRLTTGLPSADMGRIGLDVSVSDPSVVYAVTEGADAGVYRSDNGGGSWRRTSSITSIPWFFGQIRVDPKNPNRVYHLGVALQVSDDGGTTFRRIGNSIHADQHAMWIDPLDTDHLVVGNDGGLYRSFDAGATWEWADNLPVSQYYAIAVDNREPFYHVYGGLQDNSTWGGPVRTRNRQGVSNNDWYRVVGGDGFYSVIDPRDPNIVYGESQNGGLVRFDVRTGERKSIKPQPRGEERPFRWNWSAPVLLSPHDPDVVYFGANHVFRSPDRGDSWRTLGGDLTRQRNRDSLPVMGRLWPRDAVARHEGVADYGNISTLDESPRRAGLLFVGTDDGLIQFSSDTGRTWTRVDRFPGVPDETYVSRVVASQHDERVVYATFDGHRSNDFRPYVHRSEDGGRTWTAITANLPSDATAYVIREHHRNPDLLFVGTEFGAFVSVNRGRSWTKMTGGLPTVSVHDIVIHPRENDLLLGTHGRGIFVLDDITPIEQFAAARGRTSATLFPVRPVLMFSETDAYPGGPRGAGATADRGFSAANPPLGAWLAYHLPEGTRGQLALTIRDASGAVVRELEPSRDPGLHRVTWDLRHDAPFTPAAPAAGQGGGPRGGGGARGPLVLPGMYTAELRTAAGIERQPIEVRADPMIALSPDDWRTLHQLRLEAAKQSALLATTLRAADAARATLQEATAAVRAAGGADSLTRQVTAVQRELDGVLGMLRGTGGRPAAVTGGDDEGAEPVARPSIQVRISGANSALNSVTSLPTEYHREALAEGSAELATAVQQLNVVLAQRIPALNQALDAAGVPWSSGRPVPVGQR